MHAKKFNQELYISRKGLREEVNTDNSRHVKVDWNYLKHNKFFLKLKIEIK